MGDSVSQTPFQEQEEIHQPVKDKYGRRIAGFAKWIYPVIPGELLFLLLPSSLAVDSFELCIVLTTSDFLQN
jgi:hypothetical protein